MRLRPLSCWSSLKKKSLSHRCIQVLAFDVALAYGERVPSSSSSPKLKSSMIYGPNFRWELCGLVVVESATRQVFDDAVQQITKITRGVFPEERFCRNMCHEFSTVV